MKGTLVMSIFTADAKQLLRFIGDVDNIQAVTHCATRMRFVLHDIDKANIEKIEALDSVKGSFTQAGQFQVIIGNNVSEFYNTFQSISGIEGVSKEAVKSVGKGSMNGLQQLMANLAEIFAPLIPAIIIGGLILGFRNILEKVYFESLGGTISESFVFWDGVNHFLWLPGEAIFHFLPVGITWAITRKMGTTQILGIVLGITLVSPQLLNAYGVQDILTGEVQQWNFGFFQLDMIGYQAQVIPAMMAGFVLVYFERFWRRVTPEAISMIIVPLLALIPTIFVAHAVIGPIGWQLGKWLADGVQWGLSGSFNWLFGFIFGGLYAPFVVTGLHHMTNAVDLQLVAEYNQTILWPMIAFSNIAQGSAVLAIWWKNRDDKQASSVSLPAAISAYLGVTEPALFGVNIKYVYPLVAGMIGSAFAGMYSVATNTAAYTIGVGGLPGILSVTNQSYAHFVVGTAIAFFIPILLVSLFEKYNVLTNQTIDNLTLPKLGS